MLQVRRHTCRDRGAGLRVADRAARFDPTGTTSLRAQWEGEVARRVNAVRRGVISLVKVKDVLGISDPTGRPTAQSVGEFRAWLRQAIRREIMGYDAHGTRPHIADAWTTKYVIKAYIKGMRDAGKRLKAKGVKDGYLTDSLLGPRLGTAANEDRVNLIANRTYSALDGVTAEMERQMAVELGRALGEGLGPEETASRLVDRVDSIGETRANLIARTETIRAHAEASLMSYREAGAIGVETQAEWATAGDEAVCPACEDLEGQVFTLDQAEGMIPLHPNCRCAFLPVLEDPTAEEPLDEPAEEAQSTELDLPAPVEGEGLIPTPKMGPSNAEILAAIRKIIGEPARPKEVPTVKPPTPKAAAKFKSLDDKSMGGGGTAVRKAEAMLQESLKGARLPNEEAAAVRGYSGSAYADMNRALRRPDSDVGKMEPSTLRLINNMTAAIDRASLPESVRAYRGISKYANVWGDKTMFKPGQVFTDPGFMSVSVRRNVAKSFAGHDGVLLEVRLPAGSKVLPLDGLSNIPGEAEFVVQKGSRFKVISATKTKIVVELLP